MEIVHSARSVKLVRPRPQLVAAQFYLASAIVPCPRASGIEQLPPDTLPPAVFPNGQLHGFTNFSGVMQLRFHSQIQATYHIAVLDEHQAGIVSTCELGGINLPESLIREHFVLHVTNQRINGIAILKAAFPNCSHKFHP